MKCYATHYPDRVELTMRAEGPGGMLGDARDEMRPTDEPVNGVSYGQLRALGEGLIFLPDSPRDKRPPRSLETD